MKKLMILVMVMLAMTSCYNTRMVVGSISPTDPVIKVNTVWNHHLIYGLVPLDNATMKTQEYIENQPNYVVKTYTSFSERAGIRTDMGNLYTHLDRLLPTAFGSQCQQCQRIA